MSAPSFLTSARSSLPALALRLFTRVSVTNGIHLQAGVYDGDSFHDPEGDPARHPGGAPALRDALVLGLRTRLEF